MRWFLFGFFLVWGCDDRCHSSLQIIDTNVVTQSCSAGAKLRLDVIGDGKTQRNVVVCECPNEIVDMVTTPKIWR